MSDNLNIWQAIQDSQAAPPPARPADIHGMTGEDARLYRLIARYGADILAEQRRRGATVSRITQSLGLAESDVHDVLLMLDVDYRLAWAKLDRFDGILRADRLPPVGYAEAPADMDAEMRRLARRGHPVFKAVFGVSIPTQQGNPDLAAWPLALKYFCQGYCLPDEELTPAMLREFLMRLDLSSAEFAAWLAPVPLAGLGRGKARFVELANKCLDVGAGATPSPPTPAIPGDDSTEPRARISRKQQPDYGGGALRQANQRPPAPPAGARPDLRKET